MKKIITQEEIVSKYLGIKYEDNGRDTNTGLDCWGLVLNVVNDVFKITLPDTEYKWADLMKTDSNIFFSFDMGKYVHEVESPKFGDIMLLNLLIDNFPIHAGVCLSSKKFIHCPYPQGVVVTQIRDRILNIEGYYRLNNDICRV